MIPLSLISAFLLFHGAFFRYSAHIALFFSSFLTAHLGILLLQQDGGAPTGENLLTYAAELRFYQELIIIAAAVLITFVFIRYARKALPPLISGLSSALLPLMISSLAQEPLALNWFLILWAITAAALIIAGHLRREWTAIAGSAAAGGLALSLLFSSFYYFTRPVMLILALILAGSGFAIQKSTRKKRLADGEAQ